MIKWRDKGNRLKHKENYSILDLIADILIWIPEVLLFPIRLLFWGMRGLGRVIGNWLDVW
ncbi:hypothetical protein [Ornithinibacillus caprae]|uniref:hypothetical protein n=1 Tax=Ornithinibacillus caprae TaxID=2678566 RepID=UPI001FE78B3A|nr:hypothetical protein [Ornithinibacillus caprae]